MPDGAASAAVAPASTNLAEVGRSRPSRNGGSSRNSFPVPVLPEPLDSASLERTVGLRDVPTATDLAKFLEDHSIDTSQWGKGNTKDVKKFWTEIELDESCLEVWRQKSGELVPVRVTHVLRAKVSSPENRQRGIYLFNTWQQYGDGRKRTRNGLLSEKLCVCEMPLQQNLHAVCSRAVVEEEMAFVVDSTVKVHTGKPPPEYDPDYKCPLQVVDEDFIEHTIEIETSKSYPGLMTMYHLYTVDIVCDGLPTVDFNTLEFEHATGKDGKRKLKYVHAWVWLKWDMIQRYLYESSEVKARKTKGSFQDPSQLTTWLAQFNLDLSEWGQGGWKTVQALWKELENEETVLELWSRMDGGVPLLLRVVHVIQLKLASADVRQSGKVLFLVWQQTGDGFVKHVNRPMSRKLSMTDVSSPGKGCFTQQQFTRYANLAIQDQLGHLTDTHTRIGPTSPPERIQGYRPTVAASNIEFSDYRYDLEDSPSFKDMVTMYHLYTVDVACDGLPVSDFASVVTQRGAMTLYGWSWITWQQSIDILHARAQMRERQKNKQLERLRQESKVGLECLAELSRATSGLRKEHSDSAFEITRLCEELNDSLKELRDVQGLEDQFSMTPTPTATSLPPGIIAELANRKLVSDSFLDEAEAMRRATS